MRQSCCSQSQRSMKAKNFIVMQPRSKSLARMVRRFTRDHGLKNLVRLFKFLAARTSPDEVSVNKTVKILPKTF